MVEDNSAEIVSFLEKNGFEVNISKSEVSIKRSRTHTFDLDQREFRVSRRTPWKKPKVFLFSNIRNFEFETIEQYADASPFHDGYKEYIHTVDMGLKDGMKKLRLFSFVDRDPEGEHILGKLMDYLSRLIA